MIKRLIKRSLARAGLQISPTLSNSIRDNNPDITDTEWEIYSSVNRYTMLSVEGILANIRAVDHILRSRIAGDIVECGVWRGGSSMSMALALNHGHDASRSLWMYDTYAGMTNATVNDVDHKGDGAAGLLARARQDKDPEDNWVVAYAGLEQVKSNMASTGHPLDRIRFIKGPVEETVPREAPEAIAILRLDTDWYESTLHELIHLYPRLSPGGILIIDDYGHWQGARKAVDEYFKQAPLFLNRIDYSARLGVKPA
jgi:O-methyltransferase